MILLGSSTKDVIKQVKERVGAKSTYWVCRVYANKDMNCGKQTEEQLTEYINYNKTYRFGCALIIEGKCYYTGYYKLEQIAELEEYVNGKK